MEEVVSGCGERRLGVGIHRRWLCREQAVPSEQRCWRRAGRAGAIDAIDDK